MIRLDPKTLYDYNTDRGTVRSRNHIKTGLGSIEVEGISPYNYSYVFNSYILGVSLPIRISTIEIGGLAHIEHAFYNYGVNYRARFLT